MGRLLFPRCSPHQVPSFTCPYPHEVGEGPLNDSSASIARSIVPMSSFSIPYKYDDTTANSDRSVISTLEPCKSHEVL